MESPESKRELRETYTGSEQVQLGLRALNLSKFRHKGLDFVDSLVHDT
jgi:hypothetical protein